VLIPTLSLWDNLHFVASLYGLRHHGRARRFREVLDVVDLWPHRRKLLSEASGGMQRRLMLAATLVHDPELLFLDEPTAGVDPILRDRFWDRFRTLRNAGHTLVVSTQYVGEATMCDAVAVIADGRLLAVDTPIGLRRSVMGGDLVDVRLPGSWVSREQYDVLRSLDGVRAIHRTDDGLRFVVDNQTAAVPMLLQRSQALGLDVASVEPVVVPYDDVFVALVHQHQDRLARANQERVVYQ
jgi:ABC-2 type transport system ATP-binding protein